MMNKKKKKNKKRRMMRKKTSRQEEKIDKNQSVVGVRVAVRVTTLSGKEH